MVEKLAHCISFELADSLRLACRPANLVKLIFRLLTECSQSESQGYGRLTDN
jgi:hypothetical protein